MKSNFSYIFTVLALLLIPAFLFSQQTISPQPANSPQASAPQKFALVIGNGAYSGGLPQLANPVNDANDVAAALESLGFTVEKVLNGTLQDMEDASLRLKDNLSVSADTYGFFFYAGHGVQSGGDNYLIPVNADIPTESYLRTRAVSVQTLLDDLNDARNGLNVVVLDACRDNPFGWNRSTTRGLTIISRQPADSIIVYSTSAGQRASDGEGHNGLFTSQLLPNLLTPGLEVKEVFNRTGADVSEVSQRQQIPAVYNQFFGTAYLGTPPDGTGTYVPGSARPNTQPYIVAGRATPVQDKTKLWSVGVSAGTSLADPWAIGTVRGTAAPFSYSFFELGLDYGMLSGDSAVGYYEFYPYVHADFYYPIGGSLGVYAGAGGGYLTGQYTFPEGKQPVATFAMDINAGVSILNMIDLNYTFRTNFANIRHKISVGYIYRF